MLFHYLWRLETPETLPVYIYIIAHRKLLGVIDPLDPNLGFSCPVIVYIGHADML